eukprot:2657375-Rhodomonas_salina.1
MIIGTDLMYAADNHALLHTILALSHPGTQVVHRDRVAFNPQTLALRPQPVDPGHARSRARAL